VLREPIDSDTKLSTLGLRAGDGWKGPLFGARDHRHELVLQADFAHDVLRGNRQNGRERPRAGGSLSETLRLFREKLVLSAGARLDWTEDFDPELLPSFGLVVAPTPWLRLRSHVERAYRAPNFEELYHPDEGFIRGNPDLSPEDAWNFDAGLELAFATLGPFSDLRLRGSWFRREIDESIVWILINPRTLAPVNTGSATIDGFELAASLELTRFLGLSANYTWTDSERDATGERLPGQAEEETNARLRIGPVDQWKLVGEVQRLDEILVNEGGSFELPSRTVWNASAAVDLAALPWIGLNRWVSELWVFAELNNISDEAVRDALSFPQPGRNGSAGVEVIW
jgi:outer membrane receptor protein involved in Fe transport